MTTELSILGGLTMGLLGSGHCLGMCGGIMSALSLGSDGASSGRLLSLVGSYNLGRITSYALAGALAGWLGSTILAHFSPEQAASFSRLLAGGFLIVVGLYLAGWWRGLTLLERAGQVVWSRVQPLGRRLLPVKNPLRAIAAGLLWGWLPCGLVYSALAWSLASGSSLDGALLMMSFGVGTLPSMLSVGLAARRVQALSHNHRFRQVVGTAMVIFGALTITGLPMHGGHSHAGVPLMTDIEHM